MANPTHYSAMGTEIVVHIANGSPAASEPNGSNLPPTPQAYGELQVAYDFFNAALFEDRLPPCLITLQRRSRRTRGYFAGDLFRSNRRADLATDEIAINPMYLAGGDATRPLTTLAHEMCHLWQHHFGKPSRGGYHNREWAKKMLSIGLHPSSTGEPGGTMTGQRVSHYLIPNSPIAVAIETLRANGLRLSWYDRRMEMRSTAGLGIPPTPQSGTRVKYTCPRCELNAWAKPRAHLVCGECQVRMMPHAVGRERSIVSAPPMLPQLGAGKRGQDRQAGRQALLPAPP